MATVNNSGFSTQARGYCKERRMRTIDHWHGISCLSSNQSRSEHSTGRGGGGGGLRQEVQTLTP